MSLKDIQVESGESFTIRISGIIAHAAGLWAMCSEAFVQAVLHYHRHSYDVSRCQQLYEALDDAGCGSQLTAVSAALRKTTGITGIGGEHDWKHSKQQLAKVEDWETLTESIRTAGLRAFMPPKKVKGEKADKPAVKVIKFGESVSKEKVAAFQRKLDGMTPDQVEAVLSGDIKTGTPFDNITDPVVLEKAKAFVQLIADEAQLSTEDAVKSLEMAFTKVDNHIKNSLKPRLQKLLNAANESAGNANGSQSEPQSEVSAAA